MSESGHSVAATAIFEVSDMVVAIAFYQELGLNVDLLSGGYAVVTHQNSELLHLVLTKDATPGSVYFNVPNTDAWHVRCLDAGRHPTAVEERSWGMREFSVADPSGNRIRIGQNL